MHDKSSKYNNHKKCFIMQSSRLRVANYCIVAKNRFTFSVFIKFIFRSEKILKCLLKVCGITNSSAFIFV